MIEKVPFADHGYRVLAPEEPAPARYDSRLTR